MIRLGRGATDGAGRLICMFGDGGTSKTRTAAACFRAVPEVYGEAGVYVATDPSSEELGPVLLEDRGRLDKVGVNTNEDVFKQIIEITKADWRKEGYKTVIWDTATTLGQMMLSQLANSGKFSEKHIALSNAPGAETNLPMMGDFHAAETLLFRWLSKQRESGMHHLMIFHARELRPEPGEPGEPYGGPAFCGQQLTRKIGNWYNMSLRFATRVKKRTDLTKPAETEFVVHTTDTGIWKAKFRLPQATNPVPEVVLNPDPVNLWQTLERYLNPVETKK